ncbi:MAG: methyltransferase domain-containing protein [Marinicella sp.]
MTKNHWTAYWHSGVLTSLPMDFKENYDGELALYWERILTESKQSIEILDVCTGNGAIAILLQELAEKHQIDVRITAVDASDIKPSVIHDKHPGKSKVIDKIQFIGNCLVEEMDKQFDHKFDLIVSQYGLEYCDTKSAASSILSLLSNQGRLVFVSHSPETDIHKYMRSEETVYQYFDDIRIMDLFDQFGSGQYSANGFSNKLTSILEQMKIKFEFRSQALFQTWVNASLRLLQMNNSVLKTQRKQIKDFVLQYQYARARALDMLQVSDKLTNDPDWYMSFEQAGLKLINDGDIFYQEKHNAGHYYEFLLAESIEVTAQ